MTKKLKILMIGNSFSICVGKNLPRIAAAAGYELVLGSAYIGGCSLETHCGHLLQADVNREHKPYRFDLWRVSNDGAEKIQSIKQSGNVNEMLLMEDWDIVTIQQASHHSWDYSTYQPFAQQLIARIKRDAPRAQIVIQQTWSYCASDSRLVGSPNFSEEKHWEFNQTEMYERLTRAYLTLAKENHLAVIPTGFAIQLFRQNAPVSEQPPTRQQVLSLVYPNTITQAGEPVGNVSWFLDSNTNKHKIAFDTIHLNPTGEYLQGCVWFFALFKNTPDTISYIPEWMDARTASFCQEIARRAVREFCGEVNR